MQLLITGAGGQVGQALLGISRAAGHAVTGLGHAELDITDPASVDRAVAQVAGGVVINAAAYTAVDRAETDREAAHAINAVAPGVLAEEAKRCGALLVHFSTDYVYDGTKPAPYVEADAVNPLSVYGSTKLDGERAIAATGCAHLILRTSWVYGPRGKNFLFTMLRLGRERAELRIVDDQKGAPTSSRALARLVRELLDRGGDTDEISREEVERCGAASGLYHATAAGTTTWFGFAQAIFDEMERQRRLEFRAPRLVPIATSDYPTPARRPANSVMSNEKLAKAFDARIEDWRAGLVETVSAIPR